MVNGCKVWGKRPGGDGSEAKQSEGAGLVLKRHGRAGSVLKGHGRAAAVLMAGLVLGVLAHVMFLSQQTVREDFSLERSSWGQGSRAYSLLVDGLFERELPVEVELQERVYTKEEAYVVYERLLEELPTYILGDNASLMEVRSNLNLISSIDQYGVRLSWQSDDVQVLDSFGEVHAEGLSPQGKEVFLKVRMTDGSWPEEYLLPVRVMPPLLTAEEELEEEFLALIKQQDEAQKTEDSLVLPIEFEGRVLSYRSAEKSPLWQLVVLGAVGAVLVELKSGNDVKKQEELRKRQMLLDYSEVLSRLIIFLGAGMSIRSAWDKISGDYRQALKRGRRGKRFIYEEMYVTSCQLGSGVSENKAFQEFGRRCGLLQYTKLVSLLEQNRKNGSRNLRETLKLEMAEAFEQRKHQARRLGEEAGTKLLLPLFMLLTVVMIMIAVPALIEFR